MMKRNGLNPEETKINCFSEFNPFLYETNGCLIENIRSFPGIMCRLFRLLQYHKGLPDAFRL